MEHKKVLAEVSLLENLKVWKGMTYKKWVDQILNIKYQKQSFF